MSAAFGSLILPLYAKTNRYDSMFLGMYKLLRFLKYYILLKQMKKKQHVAYEIALVLVLHRNSAYWDNLGRMLSNEVLCIAANGIF